MLGQGSNLTEAGTQLSQKEKDPYKPQSQLRNNEGVKEIPHGRNISLRKAIKICVFNEFMEIKNTMRKDQCQRRGYRYDSWK
jgi:hypothetical protein